MTWEELKPHLVTNRELPSATCFTVCGNTDLGADWSMIYLMKNIKFGQKIQN